MQAVKSQTSIITLMAIGFLLSGCTHLSSPMPPPAPSPLLSPAKTIKDKLANNTSGPEMTLIPDGEFIMGSAWNEPGRYEDEGPQHRVHFKKPFFLGTTQITVQQFKAFIEHSGYITTAEKSGVSNYREPITGEWIDKMGISWRHDNKGMPAPENFPVVHVTWLDTQAYIKWLSNQTGKRYRLPTEAELEYANRAGSSSRYWWGDNEPGKLVANIKGENDFVADDKTWFPTSSERNYAYSHGTTPSFFEGYGDGYWGLAPVASFSANPFGLYDTAGNAWEWTEDCWNGSYHGAPDDGSAWTRPNCKFRVVRGGSYYCFPRHVRSANRWKLRPNYPVMYVGFRVARDL